MTHAYSDSSAESHQFILDIFLKCFFDMCVTTNTLIAPNRTIFQHPKTSGKPEQFNELLLLLFLLLVAVVEFFFVCF